MYARGAAGQATADDTYCPEGGEFYMYTYEEHFVLNNMRRWGGSEEVDQYNGVVQQVHQPTGSSTEDCRGGGMRGGWRVHRNTPEFVCTTCAHFHCCWVVATSPNVVDEILYHDIIDHRPKEQMRRDFPVPDFFDFLKKLPLNCSTDLDGARRDGGRNKAQ